MFDDLFCYVIKCLTIPFLCSCFFQTVHFTINIILYKTKQNKPIRFLRKTIIINQIQEFFFFFFKYYFSGEHPNFHLGWWVASVQETSQRTYQEWTTLSSDTQTSFYCIYVFLFVFLYYVYAISPVSLYLQININKHTGLEKHNLKIKRNRANSINT